MRENWSNSLGFFLASVGSAIGLGNIWLFPWRLGEYGGMSFLIPYLIFSFVFILFGLMAELAFGRMHQKGTIGAFQNVFSQGKQKLATFLGGFQTLSMFGLVVFYFIALGWVIYYFILLLSGNMANMDAEKTFSSFVGSVQVVPWHAMAIVLTIVVVASGVQKGLERLNKFAIPALFILFGVLLFNSLSLAGAEKGIEYMLQPKWDKLWEPATWVMALGQSFFTVSLGGMFIYGSYLSKKADIPNSAFWIVITNFLASMLAALVIIPAVFAFNFDPAKGPGLLFITLPQLFNTMAGGQLWGILFFFSVLLAGLSSAVNLLEVPVEGVMHCFNLKRKISTFIVATVAFIVGLPLALNMDFFGLWADTVTIYIYPLSVLVIILVAQWVLGSDKILEEINQGAKIRVGKWVINHLRYGFVAVGFLVIILGILYKGIG